MTIILFICGSECLHVQRGVPHLDGENDEGEEHHRQQFFKGPALINKKKGEER